MALSDKPFSAEVFCLLESIGRVRLKGKTYILKFILMAKTINRELVSEAHRRNKIILKDKRTVFLNSAYL